MYRTMVGLLDPLAASGLDIDTSACLPVPSPPDYGAYRTIIAIYILCLFLAVLEAYGLRMRRAVAACYYPKRERQRAVWLYNQILFKRGSFFKFARRQIRRKYKDEKEIQVGRGWGVLEIAEGCECGSRFFLSVSAFLVKWDGQANRR